MSVRRWIGQQENLIEFTLMSLARRKVKTLVLLGVYTAIVFLLASVMLFTNALRHDAAQALAHAPDLTIQRMTAGRHDLIPESYLQRVTDVRGIRSATGRLWGYYYDQQTKANYTFMVPSSTDLIVASGHAVVGPSIAALLDLHVGTPMIWESYTGQLFTFTIDAILPADSSLFAADLVLVSADDFRAFFDFPLGQFTDIAVGVTNPQELSTIALKLTARLPNTRAIVRDEVLRTYDAVFNWREGVVLALLFGAVLAFAILALEKASGLTADETREIGILKAIGWETSDVIRMKAWEGALLSLTAFFLGYIAAYLHVFHWSSSLFEPVLRGWSVMSPRFDLTPSIDGLQLTSLFVFTVLPYVVATIVPIWRAATTDPDTVMRG
jgi:ABC-type lipoprotein release transport system permease subunit